MSRATEELLAQLHNETAHEIRALLRDEDPEVRARGLSMAIRFLKDNNITAQLQASNSLQGLHQDLQSRIPSTAELEALMKLTPDE